MRDYLLKIIKPFLCEEDFSELVKSNISDDTFLVENMYVRAKELWFNSSLLAEVPKWYQYLLSESLALLTLKFAILDWTENPPPENRLGHLKILEQVMHIQENAKRGELLDALKKDNIKDYEVKLGTEHDNVDGRKWERNHLYIRLDYEENICNAFHPEYFLKII